MITIVKPEKMCPRMATQVMQRRRAMGMPAVVVERMEAEEFIRAGPLMGVGASVLGGAIGPLPAECPKEVGLRALWPPWSNLLEGMLLAAEGLLATEGLLKWLGCGRN